MIKISELVTLERTLLNKFPNIGRSPKNGTLDMDLISSDEISPPITMVSPSFRRTMVSADRFWKLYAFISSTYCGELTSV